MKINVLSGTSRLAGGLFFAVKSLCIHLSRCGVDVTVLGSKDRFMQDDIPEWAPVRVFALRSFSPLEIAIGLRSLLMQHPSELIHVHGLWLANQWEAMHWQRKELKPVIISPHGMLDPWALRNSAWKKKIVGRLFADESLHRATCIHALCRSELESIRAYGLKNPVAVIPNGVELPEIGGQRSEVGGQRSAVGSQQSEDRGRKKLLFLGRIHPKKGLKELIDAWGMKYGAWRKDWQLLIAGWDDGNHLAGLKQQAAGLGLSWLEQDSAKGRSSDPRSLTSNLGSPPSVLGPPSSDLCFIGPKFGDEKDVLLRSVDAFILPSFSEGLPMSVLEAWSYSLPVVMTEFCNLPEGFNAGAALRVAPDADSIARGLNELSGMSEAERCAMGGRGRALMERRFTWDHVAAEMKAVYEWCLGGDKPACIEA